MNEYSHQEGADDSEVEFYLVFDNICCHSIVIEAILGQQLGWTNEIALVHFNSDYGLDKHDYIPDMDRDNSICR